MKSNRKRQSYVEKIVQDQLFSISQMKTYYLQEWKCQKTSLKTKKQFMKNSQPQKIVEQQNRTPNSKIFPSLIKSKINSMVHEANQLSQNKSDRKLIFNTLLQKDQNISKQSQTQLPQTYTKLKSLYASLSPQRQSNSSLPVLSKYFSQKSLSDHIDSGHINIFPIISSRSLPSNSTPSLKKSNAKGSELHCQLKRQALGNILQKCRQSSFSQYKSGFQHEKSMFAKRCTKNEKIKQGQKKREKYFMLFQDFIQAKSVILKTENNVKY